MEDLLRFPHGNFSRKSGARPTTEPSDESHTYSHSPLDYHVKGNVKKRGVKVGLVEGAVAQT